MNKQQKDLLKRRYFKEGEDFKGMCKRVATKVSAAEDDLDKRKVLSNDYFDIMYNLDFLPNSPTLMPGDMLSACFVLPIEDSMESIFGTLKDMALVEKAGGGCGFSFSRLRPEGDTVQGTGGVSSGPLPFIEAYDAATHTIKQGGRRRGANMGVLRVDHPDIEKFVRYKTENDLPYFNLSVGATNEFMECAIRDEKLPLINPRNYQVWNDIKIWDYIEAEELLDLIAECAWRSGEPGMLFLDTINKDNPTPSLEEIETCNPCGETPLLPYESCNLGSINLANHLREGEIDCNKLESTVRTAVKFLDNVIDVNDYPLPEIEEATQKTRKIGLGVMGWAETLIRIGVPYDSPAAQKLAETLMCTINDIAHDESWAIARRKGAYPKCADEIATRNATLTTIAPTGSISQIAGTTPGIEPLFAREYTHTDADGNVSSYKFDFVKGAPDEVAVTAHEIAPIDHIKMQAAFQKYTDNAVSKTINLPHDATVEDVKDAYIQAWQRGCKGITVYRDGSRGEQVINSADKEIDAKDIKEDKQYYMKDNPVSVQDRPPRAKGVTTEYQSGCGKLYITINENDAGAPIETFLNNGSHGGCKSMTEGLSRMVSLALRAGVDVGEVIDQLQSAQTCSACVANEADGRSCPDIVGRALGSKENQKTLGELKEGYFSSLPTEKCPECGNKLINAEGCQECMMCGYSKC